MGKEDQLFSEFDKVSKSDWEEIVKRDLKGADYKKKLLWDTLEGFSAGPYYTREDLDGAHTVISTKTEWTTCEPVYEDNPAQIAALLNSDSGSDAFLIRLTISEEAGVAARDIYGAKIVGQEDFNTVVDAAKSSAKKLIFDAGMASPAILAMVKNSRLQKEDFLLMYDPFSYIAEYGRYPAGQDRIKKIINECVETDSFCLCADGSFYKHAGATIVQEVAAMLALASEYIAAVPENRREQAANSLFVKTAAGPLYFPEMAKIRALRLLWKLLLKEFDINSDIHLPIFAESSKANKPLSDTHNNMVRVVSEGMSAVIGGADYVMIHPYNEYYEEPSDFSKRIARNVQHILREESHLGRVADPAAGSYYIENMTDEIAGQSWDLFKEIEAQGGFLKSAEQGTLQEMIQASAGRKKQEYATRKRVLVGTNNYPNSADSIPDSAKRPLPAETLPADEKAVTDLSNNQPIINTLAEKFAGGTTIGEWAKLFYDPGRVQYKILGKFNAGEELDSIRQKTLEMQKSGQNVTVQLVQVGNKTWRHARASFSANFLGCAGFEIRDPGGLDTLEEALKSIESVNADIYVLCSSDEEVAEMADTFADALPEDSIIVLAGNPGKNEEQFRAAGFDFFIHLKSNLPDTLRAIQDKLNREEESK
jgi:methylmalonyl-CoA mutase